VVLITEYESLRYAKYSNSQLHTCQSIERDLCSFDRTKVHIFSQNIGIMDFLCTLYPLEDLSLKDLTLKLIALVALATAARA
jgi:hypothetical protein